MGDTIHKWARRELEVIRLNGRSLDVRHLSALARVAAEMADDAIQEADAARAAERALVERLSRLADEWEADDASEASMLGPTCGHGRELRAALRPEAATTEGEA